MLQIKIFNGYNHLSEAAADLIIDLVKDIPNALLCFATGNTPVGTYNLLAKKAKAQQVSFNQCFCIGLDEWAAVPAEKSGTCYTLLHKQVFNPLGIGASQIHLFNGNANNLDNECKKMNELIQNLGGIDLMIAGIGTNGHIGFNEPGVNIALNAHVQQLHTTTLGAGQQYFNEPVTIQKGITLGLAQVLKAKTLLMLANGKNKAAIIKQTIEGPVTNNVPASYIQLHNNAVLLLDAAAASLLKEETSD